MGHLIPNLFEVPDINVQVNFLLRNIEPLKKILEDADFYEAISLFWLRIRVLINSTKLIKRIWVQAVTTGIEAALVKEK